MSIDHILTVSTALLAAVQVASASASASNPSKSADGPLGPEVMAISEDGSTIHLACSTAERVLFLDPASGAVRRVLSVPAPPTGLLVAPDGKRLFVTCAAPESSLCVFDTASGRLLHSSPLGHTAMSPVVSPDGKSLFVCHRFNNEVAFVELATGRITRRVPVPREPVSAAVTPDGKLLYVANHLHAGRSDLDVVASSVSVIDITAGKVAREIPLPNGSGLLRDIKISPDGRHAAVTHLLSRFHLPTTQIERGWINSAAITILDMDRMECVNTVLLDNVDRGAANPWALAWTADGARLLVTHAGTHELSVIDFPALLAKLNKLAAAPTDAPVDYTAASRTAADVPNDLSFLVGLRERIPLAGRGPRAVAVSGQVAFVASYFSDTVEAIDLAAKLRQPRTIALGPDPEMTGARLGEFYFNDASICFQGWQSCSSCHSWDARVDGLNWDNLNDGIGNPKNAKSLLLAHQTPPMMALGVRETVEVAVRAGIRHSLFTVQPESVPEALAAYLQSLKPIPSPQLSNGKLSASAERGRKLFHSDNVGCASCHQPPLFTDLKCHDVGTRGKYDQPNDRFDTPTLIEIWRSAPYLHDGSAATIRDVLTGRNQKDKHGQVEQLTPDQLDDLIAYVLSL